MSDPAPNWNEMRLDPFTPQGEFSFMSVRLPEGRIRGLDIQCTGPSSRMCFMPIDEGYNGIIVCGAGIGRTIIDWNDWGRSVAVGPDARNVYLSDVTVVVPPYAKSMGIELGSYKHAIDIDQPALFTMRDVHLVTNADGEKTGSYGGWGISNNGFATDYKRVTADLGLMDEHFSYDRNSRGLRWEYVYGNSAGAEHSKAVNRPDEGNFYPGAQAYYKDCGLRQWFGPNSWRGGGAIVHQGAGFQTCLIENSGIYGEPTRLDADGGEERRSRCIMVDDGQNPQRPDEVRYYGLDGTPGGEFANGWYGVLNTGIQSYGAGGRSAMETVRIASTWETEEGRPHYVAKGLRMEGVGGWGANSGVMVRDEEPNEHGIGDIPQGCLMVRGCNTDAIRRFSEQRGFPVDSELVLRASGKPLSEDYMP